MKTDVCGYRNPNSPFHRDDRVQLRPSAASKYAGMSGVVTNEPRARQVQRVYVRIEGHSSERQVPVGWLVKQSAVGSRQRAEGRDDARSE